MVAEDVIAKQTESEKDIEALNYFLNLKRNYENQREPWERKWEQALDSYHLNDKLDKIYEGRSNIQVPVMKWKVNGLVARIARIIFNIEPIGRLESTKIDDKKKGVVDLWNAYIFELQLGVIKFKYAFKHFIKNKTIQGSAVAKITQEIEEKDFSFFDDEEPEKITVKDNTYFRNLLLTEFYSDVNKEDINESQACIQSSIVTMEELKANEERTETEQIETEFGIEEVSHKVPGYKNLDLITQFGESLTDEQTRYIELLGLNAGQTSEYKKSLKELTKTGFVQIDECYGRYDLNGDGTTEEVLCTIAQGRVVIRLEPTPFKHKKYVRPFIFGRYEPIANCLYGNSNVISGKSLLMELNASRAQSTDAKTRSVANMWYMDDTKNVRWDRTWRPNGVIHGQGQNGMVPLINPNLSNVSIMDSELISKDLDQLWSLSPVQEGTSDNRLIPSTAKGTAQLINQNDMPLNDIIDNTIENELKPFFEMLYERNIVFKNVEDLLEVWDEKDIEAAGIKEDAEMKDFLFDFNVKILGNLELSNEVAHQRGWQQFIAWAMNVPPVAKRLDWQGLADKQLRSFGIKDDAEGIWLNPKVLLEVDQEQAKAQQAQGEQQEAQVQKLRGAAREDETFSTELKTEAKLVEMQAEAAIEKRSGQKVD